MSGLEQYIKIHGKHLTEELVGRIYSCRWSSEDILNSAQRKVYYNVISATPGDILYIIYKVYTLNKWSKSKCIDYCLSIIGDYSFHDNYIFDDYLEMLQEKNIEINFEDFI